MDEQTEGNDLAERLAARIAAERVTPVPRWRFALSNVAFWGTWVLATVLGAIAAAVVAHDLIVTRWDLLEATHRNRAAFLVDVAPWAWVLSLAAFVVVGVVAMRATRRGYRRKVATAALLSAIVSLALGLAFHAAGVGRAVDARLPERGGPFRPSAAFERDLWNHPEEGRLAGRVAAAADGSFTLVAADGSKWRVLGGNRDALESGAVATGAEVRVLGLPATTTGTVEACLVLPWRPEDAPRPPRGDAPEPPVVSEGCRASPWYGKLSARFGRAAD